MSYLQDLASLSDQRTTCIDERWWTAVSGERASFALYDSDEPTWADIRFEVCPICNGKGKHVNPAIDAHGLTREDFDEDPDFEESYFRGDYDQTCNLCLGQRVVPVPLDPEIVKQIEERSYERYHSRQEQLAEMRMGA